MKDVKYIFLFSIVGLAIAYIASVPLRRPKNVMENIGTPLDSQQAPVAGQVYAQGTISLESGINAAEASERFLFLIVRSSAGGAPVAVRKFDRPSFPLTFSIGPESNMVGTDFFEGDLTVLARLDKDGAAGPKQPEDWEGFEAVQAAGSSRRVDIVIKK